MIPFTCYTAKGVICTSGYAPTEGMVKLQSRIYQGVLVGVMANMETQYVDLSERGNPVVRDKKAIAPSVQGTLISGLPIPCTLVVSEVNLPDLPGVGTVYDIPDGTVDFSSTLPGTYRLVILAEHHIPATVILTVP